MATFKSLSHARKSMAQAKREIRSIIDTDLENLDVLSRTLEFWYSTLGRLPENDEKKKRLETLEKDIIDIETYLLYAKSTTLNKDALT